MEFIYGYKNTINSLNGICNLMKSNFGSNKTFAIAWI